MRSSYHAKRAVETAARRPSRRSRPDGDACSTASARSCANSSRRSPCSSSRPRQRPTTVTSTARPRASTPSACSTTHTIAYLDLTGSGIETVAHLRENGRITLMFCAFAGRPTSSGSTGAGACRARPTRPTPPLCSRGSRVPGRAGGHRRRRRAGLELVRLRRAAHDAGERRATSSWTGRPRRARPALAEYRAHEERPQHRRPAGAPGARVIPDPRRLDRAACPHGRARRRRAPALRRARPAVLHRLRGDAARAAHDVRAPAATATRCSLVPRLEAPRVDEHPDLFAVETWDETDDPVARVAGDRRPTARGRDRRPDLGPLRARAPARAARPPSSSRPREVTASLRIVKDADRGRGIAVRRARGRRRSPPRCARSAFAGRREVDVHHELVERMLEAGHERANFAIVAAAAERREPAPRAVDAG